MKILIIGAGDVGTFLANNLSDEHDITIIEAGKKTSEHVRQTLDVLCIHGGGDNPDTLIEAGLEQADIVLAVTGDDRVNLMASSLAHSLGVSRIIARITDPAYMQYPKLLKRPEILTVNPSTIFAESVTNLIGAPFAVKTETFAGGKIQMLKLMVEEGAPMADRKLSELGPSKHWIYVAISRDGEIRIPKGDTVLLPGDYIYALGMASELTRLKEQLGVGDEQISSVIVAGGGHLGIMVAKNLSRRGISVKIIEIDPDRAVQAKGELAEYGVRVFTGDGNDSEILKEAGIASTDYFIALTSDDENNVLSALLAGNLGVGKTIVLYTKSDYINVIESIGVHRALSVRIVTANEILSFLKLRGVEHVALVEEGKAEVLEFVMTKDTKLLGVPLSECGFPEGALAGIVLSGTEVIIPRGDYVPAVGDVMIVFALPDAVKSVEKVLGA